MPPLVTICGRSDAGKTTVVERIIRHVTAHGFRVASIKDYHGAEPLDTPGKDTARHRKAGAVATVLRAPGEGKMFFPLAPEEGLASLATRLFPDVDLIVAEGFKAAPVDKVEVARASLAAELLCRDDPRLVAVVTDFVVDEALPRFPQGDEASLGDFLLDRYLSGGPS